MTNLIGLKEFRATVPDIAKKIMVGQTFTVLKKSKPIFRVVPVEEETWETVADFTLVKKGGVDIQEILKRL